jgi:hypothetical protein
VDHPKISKASVLTYLHAKGYPVNWTDEDDPSKITVEVSKVPFQVP